jgi:ATP-dependent RNA helicase RhlE
MIVATPGRLIDILKTSSDIKLDNVGVLIIDEVDLMFQMGFIDQESRFLAEI